MKIAVINEVSSCAKNPDVVKAFEQTGNDVLNLGMKTPDQKPELTYLHTALMSAITIELGIADIVIGGCGTGQGYLNAVLQFPRITCAHVLQPLDAWLAKRINDPNCISLALNQGYGWASDINLKMIANSLCEKTDAKGYPPAREESQTQSRVRLNDLSRTTHKPLTEIVGVIEPQLVKDVMGSEEFRAAVESASSSELKGKLLGVGI